MRKPSQFLRYSYIYFIFPRLHEIIHYKDKDLSFEQFSKVIVQYFIENKIGAMLDQNPEAPFFSMTIKELHDSFFSWWDKLSENKKNFIVSRISMNSLLRNKICPKCESAFIRNGKAQKIEKNGDILLFALIKAVFCIIIQILT